MSKEKKAKEIPMAPVGARDVEELACKIVGLDYDEIDADTQKIEDALYHRFGIGVDVLSDIVSRLLPLIDVGESPISKKRYKGFSDTENQMWLVKMEIPNPKKKSAKK